MAYKGFDLTGKVSLVTGGNGGIGFGMADAMAEAGADGTPITAKARDGVAIVDQAEIELTALEDAEIVLVETDKLN